MGKIRESCPNKDGYATIYDAPEEPARILLDDIERVIVRTHGRQKDKPGFYWYSVSYGEYNESHHI